jgi:isopenicillin-N epimerase
VRDVLPGALRAAAGRLARFLHAEAQDVAFVENATAGMNAVLRSLEFRRGDEILATTHTYNAVRQTIREVCRRTGAKLVEARIDLPVEGVEGLVFPIKQKMSRRTKLVVLDHIASPTGLIFPVQRLARFVRGRGARVLVDGAHAPGQLALDLPSLGVDWYAGNCHKWLFAPKGCGFLWARRGAQAGIHPPVISHGYGKGYAAEFDWPGTRDFSAWLAVPAAIDFFMRMNPSRLRGYNHRLATAASRQLAAAWDSIIDGAAQLHGSMMAVRLPGQLQRRAAPELMTRLLARHRIVVPIVPAAGALWARISAQIYNQPGDYERLRRAICTMAGKITGRSTP